MGVMEYWGLVEGLDVKAKDQGQFGTYWAKKLSQAVRLVKGPLFKQTWRLLFSGLGEVVRNCNLKVLDGPEAAAVKHAPLGLITVQGRQEAG